MGQSQQQSGKQDGAAKRGRNPNPNGRYTTAQNRRCRMLREARKMESKCARLIRGGHAKRNGGRHERLTRHIERLRTHAKAI